MINDKLSNYLENYNSNFMERFTVCNKYISKILIILTLLIIAFTITIIFHKNEILKNTYFWFDISFIACLVLYVIEITLLYHKKIKELNNLDNQNNKIFYSNFIKDKSNKKNKNQIKNGLIKDIKIYTDKVNNQILTQNNILGYLKNQRKQNKQNLRESKSLTNIFIRLKNKLKDLTKNRKINKDNKEITTLERILDRISKVIRNLTPKIKGGSEIGGGGAEVGRGTAPDIPEIKSQNADRTNEIRANGSKIENAPLSSEQTKTKETINQELKQTYSQTEPKIIQNNIQTIDQKKIEQEIKSNVLNALENANRELVNINKNQIASIEKLSSSISSAITESLTENYNLSAKNKEENKSLTEQKDTEKSTTLTEQITNSNKKQSEQLSNEKPSEEMSIEDMDIEALFSKERSTDNTNKNTIKNNESKITQNLNIAARNELTETAKSQSINTIKPNKKPNVSHDLPSF